MKMKFWRYDLSLTYQWTVATGLKTGGKRVSPVYFVELSDDSLTGIGEASPPERYGENAATVEKYLSQVDAARLSWRDIPASMAYLETLAPGNYSAKGAVNQALWDLAGKNAGKPIYDLSGSGFIEKKHVTCLSIGIDHPDIIRQKVEAAKDFPVLKLKVGSPEDEANFRALRDVAPKKLVRIDANEAWKTPKEALQNIEALMAFGPLEFIEQPMPATSEPRDFMWLKEKSPLPIFGDESYHHADHVNQVAQCFHGVNVKLVKTGGISGALAALQAARRHGLKTMIGCMIESSVLISAAAHLAELTDYLDIDGNLLISNDPFCGVSARSGEISFKDAPGHAGLCVATRSS